MTWHPDIPLEYRNEIVTGDARVLAERIPDASVDLIFTDPVYDRIEDYRWLAETAARVLRPGGALLVWYGIGYLPKTHEALSYALRYRWRFIVRPVNSKEFHGRLLISTQECAWYDGDGLSRPLVSIFDCQLSTSKGMHLVDGANWGKALHDVQRLAQTFTQPGAVVFDPFTGGGTVPAVCKMLNRNYIAFEIDPATAARARERVANTQAMHPAFLVEQEVLDL